MVSLALMVLLAAVEPRVGDVLAVIAEPECPRLFAMLSERFQRGVPAEKWPSWCAFVGALTDVEPLGTRDGWLLFRGRNGQRKVLLDVAFDSAGKISGLRAVNDASVPADELRLKLGEELQRVKDAYGLPAMAALAMRGDEVVEVSAVGVRKLGDPTPVTTGDRWHLGSDTKAMTATLAAILVEERRIAWTTTLTEVLSDWKDVHPTFAKITLEMLLSHRAGLPAQVPVDISARASRIKNALEQRSFGAHAVLRIPPTNVGEFLYSNVGYVVAGVMLEKVAGAPWEVSMRRRLFEPLGMKSCGFGGPASPGKIDHPWAHRRESHRLVPVPPGPRSDNPPSLGPAGTVHCSLQDWARFVQMHLKGARGARTLVTPLTMAKLHEAPPGSTYALGWGTGNLREGGKFLAHDGSNTMFHARVWVAPARNVAFLVTTNAAGDEVPKAIDQVMNYLMARYPK